MPWRDPAGRFSAFKFTVFCLLFVPGLAIALRYGSGTLGPRPLSEVLHQCGTWAIRLILLSLAVSPGRAVLAWPRLMQVRRMVGVAAFAYAAAHLLLYAADQAFDLGKVASEIVLRLYLAIGFVALLILSALAITSTNGMVRRLGGRRWRRLHRLTYAAGLLAVVHFFMQTKFNVSEPCTLAGLFVWLMGYRAVAWRGWLAGRRAAWWPAALALIAAGGTALGEALYYWSKIGAAPQRVLAANWTFDMGVRPAGFVLSICLALALAGVLRQTSPGLKPLSAT